MNANIQSSFDRETAAAPAIKRPAAVQRQFQNDVLKVSTDFLSHSEVNHDLSNFISQHKVKFVITDCSKLPGGSSLAKAMAEQSTMTISLNFKLFNVDLSAAELGAQIYPLIAHELEHLKQGVELSRLGVKWPGGSLDSEYGAHVRQVRTILEAKKMFTKKGVWAGDFDTSFPGAEIWNSRSPKFLQDLLGTIYPAAYLEITNQSRDSFEKEISKQLSDLKRKKASIPPPSPEGKTLSEEMRITTAKYEVVRNPITYGKLQEYYRQKNIEIEKLWAAEMRRGHFIPSMLNTLCADFENARMSKNSTAVGVMVQQAMALEQCISTLSKADIMPYRSKLKSVAQHCLEVSKQKLQERSDGEEIMGPAVAGLILFSALEIPQSTFTHNDVSDIFEVIRHRYPESRDELSPRERNEKLRILYQIGRMAGISDSALSREFRTLEPRFQPGK